MFTQHFTTTDKIAYLKKMEDFNMAAILLRTVVSDTSSDQFNAIFQKDYPFSDYNGSFEELTYEIGVWCNTQKELINNRYPTDGYNDEQLDMIDKGMWEFNHLECDVREKIAREYMTVTGINDAELAQMDDSLEENMCGEYSYAFYLWYYINKMVKNTESKVPVGFDCSCSIMDIVDMDFTRYYDVLISPVKQNRDEEGGTHCEVCENGQEDMWSVYLAVIEGGVECIADFSCKREAISFGNIISKLKGWKLPIIKDTAEMYRLD